MNTTNTAQAPSFFQTIDFMHDLLANNGRPSEKILDQNRELVDALNQLTSKEQKSIQIRLNEIKNGRDSGRRLALPNNAIFTNPKAETQPVLEAV